MIRTFGMDYAIKPKMMFVSDFSYQIELDKAGFKGLIYEFSVDRSGKHFPCELAFQLENEPHAGLFLDSLISWIDKSEGDTDAVALDFVELTAGDYVIIISPDTRLFEKRMIPEYLRDQVDPLLTTSMQGKKVINKTNKFQLFRDSYVEGRKIAVRYCRAVNGKLEKSEKYFIKSKFNFYKEDQLPAGSNAAILLKGREGKQPEKPLSLEADDPRLLERRIGQLKFFFPVTYDKLSREQWLAPVLATLNKGYTGDQAFQAICNLILLGRLNRSMGEKVNTYESGYNLNIIEYLMENFESFDTFTPEDSYFTKSKIENQVRADAKYFKSHLTR